MLLIQENQQLKQENQRLAGECAELKEFSDTIQVLHHDLTKENQRLREALLEAIDDIVILDNDFKFKSPIKKYRAIAQNKE